MCHPGAPECQVTAQQQRRLPRLARDRNRLHFPGQSQRHSGFGLGFSLGNGGSEPRETLRLGAGLLEPRPAPGGHRAPATAWRKRRVVSQEP